MKRLWVKPVASLLIAMGTGVGCIYAMCVHDPVLAGISGWASGVWVITGLSELSEYAEIKLKIAKAAEALLDEAEKQGKL